MNRRYMAMIAALLMFATVIGLPTSASASSDTETSTTVHMRVQYGSDHATVFGQWAIRHCDGSRDGHRSVVWYWLRGSESVVKLRTRWPTGCMTWGPYGHQNRILKVRVCDATNRTEHGPMWEIKMLRCSSWHHT